jgi:hypothetical protein
VLQESSTKVREERNSRKEPLSDEEARALLALVKTVRIAKGRKVVEKAAGDTTPDDLKGPTGNFRAPMVRKGETLLVGFHEESLRALVS